MKTFSGPFGNYPTGSIGAVLNALCEQEGRSSGVVGNYAIGNGKVLAHPSSDKVVATFEWAGDEIKFTWL